MIKKKIGKHKMWLDPDDHGISKRLIATKGEREPAFQWILKKEAFGVAYDVGANIGYLTLMLSKTCDVIHSFEPDPRSFKILEKNIELIEEKMHDISASRRAIVERKGTIDICLAKKPNLSRLMTIGAPSKRSGVFVDGISIDEYVEEGNDYPNFIKMDIEGGEVGALRGAMKTLKNEPQIKILIEVHPQFYNKDNDFRKVLEDILKLGYKFKYVVNAKGKIDKFKNYKSVKRFKHYKHRAVFKGVPEHKVLKWATTMPKDGKKTIRSFLLEKARV